MSIERDLGEMQTLRDVLRWSVSRFRQAGLFFGHGTDNAWDEARWLVLGAVSLPHDSPDWVLDARLATPERERLSTLLRRRIVERVPTAYLLGEAWFAGLRFAVDQRVLIPRSPIAELLEAGPEPWLAVRQPERILDLCCGSGCIGIAAALRFPDARVDLADISSDALALARQNVQAHGVAGSVRVIESDLFAALSGETYDLILCNPPYVDAADMASLPPEFHHEPRLGLAAGQDGLDLARRILAAACARLTNDGLLVLEVGNSAEALETAFPDTPFLWPEFENGGAGVALLAATDLPRSVAPGMPV
ncbi:MAG: 50S ribosomal protein L3 N(5)-glutamine methyltransferase [Gammaproteobacteria bacterium]